MAQTFILMFYLILIYSSSVDCPNVISLASGLGMKTKQPAIWSQLQVDCCGDLTTTKVFCSVNRVTKFEWYSLNLNGTIIGAAIPPFTTVIFLHDNQITGPIPSSLPNTLTELYIDKNNMSGDLPLFPTSLIALHLGASGYFGNHFSGTLRLNAPNKVKINNNWITDIIVQNSSGLTNGSCDLSNNPLLDNPNVDGLGCTKNGLYSAGLLSNTAGAFVSTRPTSKLTTSRPTSIVLSVTSTFYNSTGSIAAPTLLSNSFTSANEGPLYVNDTTILTNIVVRATETLAPNNSLAPPIFDKYLIIALIGTFIGLCILVGIGKFAFKHPKMHSKFGRKNSFGTLNTVATTKKTAF